MEKRKSGFYRFNKYIAALTLVIGILVGISGVFVIQSYKVRKTNTATGCEERELSDYYVFSPKEFKRDHYKFDFNGRFVQFSEDEWRFELSPYDFTLREFSPSDNGENEDVVETFAVIQPQNARYQGYHKIVVGGVTFYKAVYETVDLDEFYQNGGDRESALLGESHAYIAESSGGYIAFYVYEGVPDQVFEKEVLSNFELLN
jgi:hypothetical protein